MQKRMLRVVYDLLSSEMYSFSTSILLDWNKSGLHYVQIFVTSVCQPQNWAIAVKKKKFIDEQILSKSFTS